ncbi:hypothetical protein RvY_12365 [Ramazzottius varieornatus]|uniref:Uncharacterized protein n=1 Tax=Ramazzottius varieornatus TaxID=947166 RepID=A0A1D1VJ94_RAMVA|nr:hypothetical protein RvY_12365 [Ramazzottius varieornatus]
MWLVTVESKGSGLLARIRSAMTSIGAERQSNLWRSVASDPAPSTPATTEPSSTAKLRTEVLPYSKPWVEPLPEEMESPETDKPWDGLSPTITDEPDTWQVHLAFGGPETRDKICNQSYQNPETKGKKRRLDAV